MKGKSQITGKAAPNIRAGPDPGISSNCGMRTKQAGGLRIKPQGATEAELSCRKRKHGDTKAV